MGMNEIPMKAYRIINNNWGSLIIILKGMRAENIYTHKLTSEKMKDNIEITIF